MCIYWDTYIADNIDDVIIILNDLELAKQQNNNKNH